MPFVNSVFLSATSKDLKAERKIAIEAFTQLGILPFSMEFFPADYRKKQNFIKDRIIEADIFALIIGGRYGDYLDHEKKISFTEWEYNTAVENNKKILAFVPSDLSKIPKDKTDKDSEKEKRLKKFIEKVQAVPLTRKYAYNDKGGLKESFLISFQQYGYTGKKPSKYCGTWISTIKKVIHEEHTYNRKSDEWVFYGRDNHVYGTIRRIKPRENDRIWSFIGMDFGDQLLVSFTEDKQTKMSAGIMMVHKDDDADDQMSGFYYEFAKVDSGGFPIPIRIVLKRKKVTQGA